MRLKRGGQPEIKAQVEGPQVKYICINGLKTTPLHNLISVNTHL
jgi:hypothetical protein